MTQTPSSTGFLVPVASTNSATTRSTISPASTRCIRGLFIVDPLVSWLWFGAIIMAFGGFVALWPMPFAARRRELALYRARVTRELA